MAIVMQTSLSEFKKDPTDIEIVPVHHLNMAGYVQHDSRCVHSGTSKLSPNGKVFDDCHKYCRVLEPLYLRTTYRGCVVRTYERNGYDDSDFYAIVWDEESGEFKHIEYASTRFWTYCNGASVDAPEELMQRYRDMLTAEAEAAEKARREELEKIPNIGDLVRVVKGRKVPIGTEGVVFWKGVDAYRSNRYGKGPHYYRLGIEVYSGEKVFISMDNVEKVRKDVITK